MVRDSNYLSNINPSFRIWYESHGLFPKDKLEFLDALKSDALAWQYTASSLSEYGKGGLPLAYEIVVVKNASGPKLQGLSNTPGVIYYCVSTDYQQFWVTMTGLHKDVSPSATLKRVGDSATFEPWLVTAAASDYPVRRSARGGKLD
jgi:hypothetical protein